MNSAALQETSIIRMNRANEIETAMFQEPVSLKTSVGTLIPRYTLDDQSRKKEAPVVFYSDGAIRSLPLEDRTPIETNAGVIPAELITFYPSGELKRLFPLNGKITGYWTETDEYKLAEPFSIDTEAGKIKAKPIYLEFYESGELSAICFWPQERLEIQSPIGKVKIKTGISFYEDGSIKGFEPSGTLLVPSPIGPVQVSNPEAEGMDTSEFSLQFDREGNVCKLSTVKSQFEVQPETMSAAMQNLFESQVFKPRVIRSYCSDSMNSVLPLTLEFTEEDIVFSLGYKALMSVPAATRFIVSEFKLPEKTAFTSCSGSCSSC
jgi:hypothetical protein